MKNVLTDKWLTGAVALICCVVATHGRSVREALDVLLATEYCGTGTFEGMGMSSAIRGESPVSDDGVFDVPEEEWLPVLLEMADEELEACKRDTAEDIAEIRRLKAGSESCGNSDDERTSYLWKAQRRVEGRGYKLMKIVSCLKYAEGGTAQVLDMLERIGLESPPEFNLAKIVSISMVKKACRDGQFARCLEFGRRCREIHGPDSLQEWYICFELGSFGLPTLSQESERRVCYRYLLEFSETIGNIHSAIPFEGMAQRMIPGWVGSVQRRRLAARFPDEPIPRRLVWDVDRQQYVEGEIDERRIPQMLNRRAAAELAADESELTDLRKVYGDWAEEKTIPDPIQ